MRDINTQLSSVILGDPTSTWEDKEAKSIAYFCKKNPVKVDTKLISELKEVAARLGGENVRLCLHEGPDATLHEMIVLVHKGKYYRPHKHLTKAESSYMIEGSMGIFVFDESGYIVDACLLESSENFLYRVGANMYHTIVPLTNIVIFHESKIGPFQREGDSLYPSWAPDGSNLEEVKNYTNKLLAVLKVQ
jgi:cupin fold WbuC family metalloprotein